MRYEDKIYGSIDIKENILIDLMNTPIIQRLKKVSQAGPLIFLSQTHKWKKFNTTRFDHSMGVCILLKKFNASLEEQIAGLLHDVSHTVFSHALDFLFNRQTQHDYHENFHKKMVLNSEIPSILEKFGFSANEILDGKRFTLLEKELPDICADRIDYFFRDWSLYRLTKSQVNLMLDNLRVVNDEFVFANRNSAKIFAKKFINANNLFWCNPLQATLFRLISDVVKFGVSNGIIEREDLFSTDELVYNKLKNSKHKEIIKMLNLISNLKVIEDEKNYEMHLESKIRCVDPKIIENGNIVRLSEIDKLYKKYMENFIDKKKNGFFIRIEK